MGLASLVYRLWRSSASTDSFSRRASTTASRKGRFAARKGFTVLVGFVDEGGDGAVDLGLGFVRGKVVLEGVELR